MTAGNDERSVGHAQPRLAELVMHLAQCPPERALEAVGSAQVPANADDPTPSDPLEIVASALVRLRHVDLRERIDLREAEAPSRIAPKPSA